MADNNDRDIVADNAQSRPRVIVYRKNRGNKRYSRGLRDIQRYEDGLTKAARRLSRALADGLSTYRKNRNKSSYKKRDGAIKDALNNLSKGLSKTMRRASDAPLDFTKTIKTKKLTRRLRKTFRSLPFPRL